MGWRGTVLETGSRSEGNGTAADMVRNGSVGSTPASSGNPALVLNLGSGAGGVKGEGSVYVAGLGLVRETDTVSG